MPAQPHIVINGWSLFAHPLFLDQLASLLDQFAAQKSKDPVHYQNRNAAKRLAAITRLALSVIPQDPTNPAFRQGSTLGEEHKHWFRAKFFQQYHLFFRFDSAAKIIVLAWVNDDKNKRAYGSKTDAYRVFEKMLNNGHPPDNWDQLLTAAKGDLQRLNRLSQQLLQQDNRDN